MNLIRFRRLAPATLLTAAVLVSTLTACTNSDAEGETAAEYQPATVVRVVDGDTLVVNFDGADQTVRLLNVDTPETKHPNKPVECLGLEATQKLESLTPPGAQVALDFDIERTDQYDRVLAAVFVKETTLVNAEIARVGLGVPILIEPNSKYYGDVQAAYNEATAQGVGLLDPATGCTLPAEMADAMENLAAATETPVGETGTAVAATTAGIFAALTTAKAARETLETGKDTVRVLAIGADRAATITRDLDTQIIKGERSLAAANTKATALNAAEAKERAAAAEAEAARAAEAARIETERIQAEANARAEADRQAAQAAAVAAEQERIRNLPPAPPPYVPPAPPAAQNPYPGYTGPRCYAPGGKTYRPC